MATTAPAIHSKPLTADGPRFVGRPLCDTCARNARLKVATEMRFGVALCADDAASYDAGLG